MKNHLRSTFPDRPTKSPLRMRLAPLAVACVFAAAGCTNFSQPITSVLSKTDEATANAKPQSGPTEVRVDSTALALNQPEQEAAVRRAFVERFQKLLAEKRPSAAQLWIERHPDLAWEVLRDSQPPNEPWLLEMAAFHDLQCAGSAESGWRTLLVMRATSPERDAEYREARRKLMHLLRSGMFAETSGTDLITPAQQAGHVLVEIDAWHQTGIACLLAEQPAAAVTALEQCVKLAKVHAPLQAVHAQLLLSEARRRTGDAQRAGQDWLAAADAGADLLVRPTPIADPTFWDRAMYLRPVSHAWPASVVNRIEQLASRGASQARNDVMRRVVASSAQRGERQEPLAYIATCLGSWKLERNDPQGAVVEFKKAENVATGEAVDWLRIAQAKSMASLDQTAAATALLAQIAGREAPTPIRSAAMADLGTLQLREGRIQQGVNLLRRALDEDPAIDWPGRAAADADFALALLMIGEETEGLSRLQLAKRRFEADGESESLAKCLWNEAQFLRQAKKKNELAAVELRLQQLQL